MIPTASKPETKATNSPIKIRNVLLDKTAKFGGDL